ncbi:MAG TPA: A/G-specific adenine glycosylase [Acidobacteriaceae bacterium]|nr:A/G-specific adenine glycosylase [Acidobacteriaceae bacterium]
MIGDENGPGIELDGAEFRRLLMEWYGAEARVLPWRGTTDPYRIWLSEVMLQQTRVAAVIEHYNEFVRRFPTLVSLSLATDADVLAAWSGLGYYRRARMLHKAAQFIVLERHGQLPTTAVELRTLPGIGEYTAAAVASIAFGERVAVVDGNVERVILRLVGRPEDATAAGRHFVRAQAQALLPDFGGRIAERAKPRGKAAAFKLQAAKTWSAEERHVLAATAHPHQTAGGDGTAQRPRSNPAGDHNQAMMELGAMICLPRGPLCDRCPVYELCRTRGEHSTPARSPQRSVPAACLLDLRKRGTGTEILLNLRAGDASIMPAMFELPALPLDLVDGREPVLRVRHSITNTNYYVQVFAPRGENTAAMAEPRRGGVPELRRSIPKGSGELHWVNVQRLPGMPMTGLARKILQRVKVMEPLRMNVLE